METVQDYDWLKDLQEVPLCHNCFAENHPLFHFCHKCNTPLTAIASMDPLMSVWARGDTWHKAASRPYKPIILIGMWLQFAPQVILALFTFLLFFMDYGLRNLDNIPLILLYLGYIGLYVAILARTTRNYFRLRKQTIVEGPDLDS